MNKKVKQLATLVITVSLLSTSAMPVFAEDTITPTDAINTTVIESNTENFIERGLQSRYISDYVVHYANADLTTDVPKTYDYNEYYGGYIWKGTLTLTSYSRTDTSIYAHYSGYVYTYEE